MLNLKDKYETFFDKYEKSVVSYISEQADFYGINIFFIGGLVRDLLLDRKSQDIDVLVEGDAIEFAKNLNATVVKENPDLKTVQLEFENNLKIDFASTRCEKYDKKGHLPIAYNFGVKLKEDVKRRDFTVNTLAFSLNKNNFGEVIDFLGGVNDLQNKKLKLLHDKSFIDDPTRILRGLKFQTKLNFTPDEQMKKLQDEYIENYISKDVCTERLKSEFIDIFDEPIKNSVSSFMENKLYKLFFIEKCNIVDENKFFELTQKYNVKSKWLLFFALLIKNETLENVSQIADLFYFSSKEKNILIDTVNLINNTQNFSSKYKIYKFFDGKDIKSILGYYLSTEDNQAILYLDELQNIKLQINGNDLISLGVKPSGEMKIILEKVLEEKINNSLKDKDEELNFVKTII